MENYAVLGQPFRLPRQLLVEACEGRALISRDEDPDIESAPLVQAALVKGQSHQRLHAGEVSLAVEQVAPVIERVAGRDGAVGGGGDRKRVWWGKRVSVRGELGG